MTIRTSLLLVATLALLTTAAPGQSDFTALKRNAESALAKGETSKAVELALEANHRMPDDLETYSLLVRAYLKLGRLADAEAQAQWMLDLRTEHPLSLLRAADVREAIGQYDGALAMLNDAFGRVQSPAERAEILMHAASIQRKAGRPQSAERLMIEAQKLTPAGAPK